MKAVYRKQYRLRERREIDTPFCRMKISKYICFEVPWYKYLVTTKPKVSSESFGEECEQELEEVYRKLYRLTERWKRDGPLGYSRQYKTVLALRASVICVAMETNHNVDLSYFRKTASRAYWKFTKHSTSHANKISCMSPIRQDAILTNVVDSLRLFNEETHETGVCMASNFEGIGGFGHM